MIKIKTSIKRQEGNPDLCAIKVHCDAWRLPYKDILADLSILRINNYDAFLYALRQLVEEDFFLFCYLILDLPVNHPFLLARCYEVQDYAFVNTLNLWARDHWKALGYNTPVLTTKGWKKHGELKVGDYVYGSSGTPVKVIARTKNFTDAEQYEIEFNNKIKIIASCNHLWKVNKKSRRRINKTEKRNYRDSFIMTSDEIYGHGCAVDNRLSVSVNPVFFEEKNLIIEPYVLGVWLGDGSSDCSRIHGIDQEIFEIIKDMGYEVSDTGRSVTKTVKGLITDLKKLDLKKNKHIPDVYKYASYEQRRDLIQGLFDTDGSIDKSGVAVFTNINERLARDVHEVLLSLGIKSNFKTYYGKMGNDNYVFYNVSFSTNTEFIPFKLARKANKIKFDKPKNQRYITNIIKLRAGENLVNCIQVDSSDGIYLVGKEFIPTHNSTLITFARTLWKFCKKPDNRVFLFSNSLKLATPHFKLLKWTMERNEKLHEIWPEVFWKDPEKEAEWSVQGGLYLKQNHLKDPSLAAYGLIDSMPTGGHPDERVIDDLVDLKNIGTEFMMEKVENAYRMADNLSSGDSTIETIIGTRYRDSDLYEKLQEEGRHYVSIRPAEVDSFGNGEFGGTPVLLSKETLEQKKISQKHIYHAQMLLKPMGLGFSIFKVDDLVFYDRLNEDGNYYITTDPAVNPLYTKGNKNDKTSMWLLKSSKGRRIDIVDHLYDRIGLKEKWEQLKQWVTRYNLDQIGYEEYGTQKDREFFELKMEEERFYFTITPIKGDLSSKADRIAKLVPFFTEKKIRFPKTLMRFTKDKGAIDVITDFIENEYKTYPNVAHDDRLDSLSIFAKLDIIYPEGEAPPEETLDYRKRYNHDPLSIDDEIVGECYYGGF